MKPGLYNSESEISADQNHSYVRETPVRSRGTYREWYYYILSRPVRETIIFLPLVFGWNFNSSQFYRTQLNKLRPQDINFMIA